MLGWETFAQILVPLHLLHAGGASSLAKACSESALLFPQGCLVAVAEAGFPGAAEDNRRRSQEGSRQNSERRLVLRDCVGFQDCVLTGIGAAVSHGLPVKRILDSSVFFFLAEVQKWLLTAPPPHHHTQSFC